MSAPYFYIDIGLSCIAKKWTNYFPENTLESAREIIA